MKKPKFTTVCFYFIYGNDEYTVDFTPTDDDKRYYTVKCQGPLIKAYEVDAQTAANKTTAKYYLCMALGIEDSELPY